MYAMRAATSENLLVGSAATIAMYFSGFQALYIEYFDDYKLIKTIFGSIIF